MNGGGHVVEAVAQLMAEGAALEVGAVCDLARIDADHDLARFIRRMLAHARHLAAALVLDGVLEVPDEVHGDAVDHRRREAPGNGARLHRAPVHRAQNLAADGIGEGPNGLRLHWPRFHGGGVRIGGTEGDLGH